MVEKTIEMGFKYPFKQWKRLFNFWWAIIPILGWFAVTGYFKKIIEHMLKKDFKELPKFGNFWDNFSKGLMFFIMMLIPMIIAGVITSIIGKIFEGIPFGGLIGFLIACFIDFFLALLFINYVKGNNFEDVIDVKKIWAMISKDWNKTFTMMVKQAVLVLAFIIVSIPIITLVVTIPAMVFAGYYFIVDFYNEIKA